MLFQSFGDMRIFLTGKEETDELLCKPPLKLVIIAIVCRDKTVTVTCLVFCLPACLPGVEHSLCLSLFHMT